MTVRPWSGSPTGCSRRRLPGAGRSTTALCRRRLGSLSGMFTGLVRERGRVVAVDGADGGVRLRGRAPGTAEGAALRDSVSVDGCCLAGTAGGDGGGALYAGPAT